MVVDNLLNGMDEEFPCYCVVDNVLQGSATTADRIGHADLLRCSKCGFKYWSNTKLDCPKCNSHLIQGSATRDRIKELQRVIRAPFETSYHFPPPNLK
ncbi:MAG: hypothetical protein ACRD8Z_24050 [Nitrososphaeraceae archaeon]